MDLEWDKGLISSAVITPSFSERCKIRYQHPICVNCGSIEKEIVQEEEFVYSFDVLAGETYEIKIDKFNSPK